MRQDLRFALRLLLKDRSFTITALLTLHSVSRRERRDVQRSSESVLLKPLPFPDSDRVVLLYNSYPNAGAPRVGAAVPDYFDRLTAVPGAGRAGALPPRGHDVRRRGRRRAARRRIRATPSFFRVVAQSQPDGRAACSRTTKARRARTEGDPELRVLAAQVRRRARRSTQRSVRLNGTGVRSRRRAAASSSRFCRTTSTCFVPGGVRARTTRATTAGTATTGRWSAACAPARRSSRSQQQVDALNARNDERFPQFTQILKDASFHTVVASCCRTTWCAT